MIRHILLIKFKEQASADELGAVKVAFDRIPTKIEGVTAVEWGLNCAAYRRYYCV